MKTRNELARVKILFALGGITILGLLGLSAPAVAGPYYLARGERALVEADAPAAIDQLAAAARWQPERAEIRRRLRQRFVPGYRVRWPLAYSHHDF